MTSVKETTLVTRMQTAPTPMDHIYAIVSLDILEMDKIAQVNSEKQGNAIMDDLFYFVLSFFVYITCFVLP